MFGLMYCTLIEDIKFGKAFALEFSVQFLLLGVSKFAIFPHNINYNTYPLLHSHVGFYTYV